MSKNKIDLDTLKRLVAELESTLSAAENITTDVKADKVEFVVEMSKAAGIAAGIMMEAGGVMGDIQQLVMGVNAPAKSDLLDKLLGPLKGSGNTN
jgi:hypothetical protein